jgi:beta-N-acetylhexosaminidase
MAFLLKRLVSACVALALVAAGCTRGGAAYPVTIGQCAQDCPPAASASPSTASGSAGTSVSEATPIATATPGFAAASPTPTAAATPVGCDPAGLAQQTLASLTPAQEVGQLFMVGLSSSDDPSFVLATISAYHVGNVVLYGSGWSSSDLVAASARSVQQAATAANGGVSAFVAGNQEGGAAGSFQAFYGPGFTAIPSALDQGALPAGALTTDAQIWGSELRAAGVNLDLAPVLDVVAEATARQNGPIGQYNREFGYTPNTVASAGTAFIAGMHAAREPVSIKHFPGLGRVQGNTDFTDQATIDAQLSGQNDANLDPFKAGIAAGADMVMVSSATYPRIDAAPAIFSHAIITDLLRTQLKFIGVVISDDVGAAASVAAYPPEQRATLFFTAGGDILLTVQPSDIEPMTRAVMALWSDSTTRPIIDAAALRVLTLKARYGMLPATAACAGPSAPTAPAAPAQRTSQTGR